MSVLKKLTSEDWDHDEGDHRIEEMGLQTEIRDRISRLALRFISAKGLSGEFADTLDEILQHEAATDTAPEPGPGL